MGLRALLASSLVALQLLGAGASPASSHHWRSTNSTKSHGHGHSQAEVHTDATSSWWFANIARQGTVPFGGSANYKIVRNVRDYGAKGDGSSDDTNAINAAITDGGNRCGQGCDSSTTTPAIIYFPAGTYVVSKPILSYYYTQLIGDAVNIPTLKAASNFNGIAVIDADPYGANGNWFTNQNNFFRQVRNFKIDLTATSQGTGIHWQVAQATSLQNIEFDMTVGGGQQGIYMENGSGGFMTDLTFNGGKYGMAVGSQQFTARNLKYKSCGTAILQMWGWIWTYHGLSIESCNVGIDMTSGGSQQSVGSLIVQDSTFSNGKTGILTNYNTGQTGTNGTLVLDNVDFSSTPTAVGRGSGGSILAGSTKVASWAQGREYTGTQGSAKQGSLTPLNKPAALLDGNGKFVAKSKDQYTSTSASSFISVKSKGAKGDGTTDDSNALQAIFNAYQAGQVIYFDHGAYLVTKTINVPANVKIVGEIWPMILAGGNSNFQDINNPKPVFKVGNAGDTGDAQISDIIFETAGPQPGAILVEWNVAGATKGGAGMWDVHFRVGGTAGSQLQSDKCSKNPSATTSPNPSCYGAWMLLHVTPSATIYLENSWLWVADHELDRGDHNQINIYNGRGMLVESTKGAWFWGTASEHNVLYNYQFRNAQNVYMGAIQTETAYMQGNPDAKVPYKPVSGWDDPDFSTCTTANCARTWGLRVLKSSDIYFYGGGMYSFFDNYDQTCLNTESCQQNMVDISNTSLTMFGVSTKASTNVITLNGKSQMTHLPDNKNTFCATVAVFKSS